MTRLRLLSPECARSRDLEMLGQGDSRSATHLSGCADCQKKLQAASQVSGALLRSRAPSLEAERVEAGLLSLRRKLQSAGSLPVPVVSTMESPECWNDQFARLATACALLLLVSWSRGEGIPGSAQVNRGTWQIVFRSCAALPKVLKQCGFPSSDPVSSRPSDHEG